MFHSQDIQDFVFLTQIIPVSTKEDLRLMAEISTVNRAITKIKDVLTIIRMKQQVNIEKVEKSQLDIF